MNYPQKTNILLDEGDHRSLITTYSANLYFPNYPELPLQAVADTQNLLDFSRVRVLEIRVQGKLLVIADTASGTMLLKLPLAPNVNFDPN